MKKRYLKPYFNIEHFSLAQNIAAGTCNVTGGGGTTGVPGHDDRSSCGWQVGRHVYWVNTGICTDIYSEDIEADGVCYNAPTGNIIFDS